MKKLMPFVLIVAMLLTVLPVVYAQPKLPIQNHPDWPKTIVMGAFAYDQYAPSIARQFQKRTGIQVTLRTIISTLEMMNLCLKGKLLLASSGGLQIGEVNEGKKGAGYYEPGFGKARSVLFTRDYQSTFITLDSKIKTIKDLKGKTVMCEDKSVIYRVHSKCFEYYGLKSRENFTALPKGASRDRVAALLERRVDVVYIGGLGGINAKILEVASRKPVYFVRFPREAVEHAAKFFPPGAVFPNIIPKETYDFLNEDIPVWGYTCGLATLVGTDESLMYHVVKAIYDYPEDMKGVPGSEMLTKKWATRMIKPYHSGAVKYFKEKGWWTAELEKEQSAALTRVGMKE